jgi:hypothetical protein
MTRFRALAVLLVLVALLSLPCPRPPGIEGLGLAVGFSNRALTDNLFTDITFRFETSRAFVPFTEDLAVACRLSAKGRFLAEDTYKPPVPTSKWEPNKTYSFTRRIYIPPFVDVYDPAFTGSETADLTVGLGTAQAGMATFLVEVYGERIKVLPSQGSPVIVYLSGWYAPEAVPGEPGRSYRWTAQEARCAIDNPGRDALLVVRGSVAAAAPPDQKITLTLVGRTLDEFVPERPDFEKFYAVKKEWLGGRKDFLLTISVDKTFVPAKTIPGSTDDRELGVRISLIYFR